MRELPEVLNEAYKVLDDNEYCYPEKVILGLQEALREIELDEMRRDVKLATDFDAGVYSFFVTDVVEAYGKALKLQGLIIKLLQLGVK
jgi:hypothetical protein